MPHYAFETRAVHAGERRHRGALTQVGPDGLTGPFTPVSTPIYSTVGYLYESMAQADEVLGATTEGYIYPRYGSPTVAAFESAVADLERAPAAHAFSSGMAAVHVALLAAGVKAGEAIVAACDLYGATYTLVRTLFVDLGVQARVVDASDLEQVESALTEVRPVVLLVETISNPLLKVADIPALARLANANGAQLIVDNTFATPYLFNPLAHGAHYTIHSATKYIGGHGDLMAGVVAASQADRRKMYEVNKLVGSVLSPFDAWLALRGIKTLPLRIRQQCKNALEIARWLSSHPKVRKVNYPGLPGSPYHQLAGRMFEGKGFGGVLSFEIAQAGQAADRAAVFRFMEALRVCLPATTLGDVYSLVLHPATASHRSLSAEERERLGISEGLVRLSAGIEAPEDILADLESALEQV